VTDNGKHVPLRYVWISGLPHLPEQAISRMGPTTTNEVSGTVNVDTSAAYLRTLIEAVETEHDMSYQGGVLFADCVRPVCVLARLLKDRVGAKP
jgi:hypothetical protein